MSDLIHLGNGLYRQGERTVRVALRKIEEDAAHVVFDLRAELVGALRDEKPVALSTRVTHYLTPETPPASEEPGAPPEGETWVDGGVLKLYEGGAWLSLGAAGKAPGPELQWRARLELWRRQAARRLLAQEESRAALASALG